MSGPRMECGRCGHVLVDEDDAGWYYQVPVSVDLPPDLDLPVGTVLTFMDRVHECDGRPHDVRQNGQP